MSAIPVALLLQHELCCIKAVLDRLRAEQGPTVGFGNYRNTIHAFLWKTNIHLLFFPSPPVKIIAGIRKIEEMGLTVIGRLTLITQSGRYHLFISD